jgi:starvation-inducible DNA-binding protein
MFDEHADAILGSIDVMAERVRKIGGTTIRGVSHIAKLQTIEDDNDGVPAREMLRPLMRDYEQMAKKI